MQQNEADRLAAAARLVEIRSPRFPSASEAARAIGVPVQTYIDHERGKNGLSRAGERYAAFFRVSLDWLLTGRGTKRGQRAPLQVVGLVGAGDAIVPFQDDTAAANPLDEIDLPESEYLAALEVRGDSQYPRYLDGEVVMFDTREKTPGQLLNDYAVVDLADGRRLLKMLRRMPQAGRFRLESHNAPPIDDADIVAAYAVSGTLSRRLVR